MKGKLDEQDDTDIKGVYDWYKAAQIDYTKQYIALYISYNAWYRQVSGTLNDRQAISSLKKRYIIWDDYINGKTMRVLRPYMQRLSELTQREPLMSETTYWTGSVDGPNDWRALIEYWYQVRCRVMHGSYVSPKFVWLAYETLDAFMGEVIERMEKCLSTTKSRTTHQFGSIADDNSRRSERFRRVQGKLYAKYVASPDVWQVDMRRAESYGDEP